MRRRTKQVLEWLHGSILLSVLAPVLYALVMQKETVYDIQKVWLLNLLILPVIAGTDLLMERCRKMSVYLLWSVLCAAAVNAAAWKARGIVGAGNGDIGAGTVVVLGLESLWVYGERILIRLHNKRLIDRQEENPDWQPRQSILTYPQIIYMIVIIFVYGVGKFCDNPPLCNIAMGLLPVYLCVALFYRYLERTQEYLFLNKRVCNLSRRRLYGINGSICLVFLAGIVCVGILSGLSGAYRNHRDIRGLFRREADRFEMPPAQRFGELTMFPQEEWFLDEMNQEVKEPPAWIKNLEKGMAVLSVVMISLLGVYALRRVSRLFRETFDENGDVVENLTEENEETEWIPSRGRIRKRMTEAEQIRRQYRRTIRRYRKERPERYETPYEIESCAGIADTEEGKRLHEMYERVRYHG